jgi:ABC-type glycerol-3-phosphate transport system permease component
MQRAEPLDVNPSTPTLARPARSDARSLAGQVTIYALLGLLSLLFMLPLLWLVTTSFKEQGQVFQVPPVWLPDPWRWQNYVEATQRAPLWTWLRNTAAITVLSTAGNVLVASMVAFGFARLRFPGRDALFILMLSTMMLPPVVTIIPRFMLFKEIGWNDTYLPLVVPAWFGGGAFNIFLLRQFYLTIPLDLDEAAKIDGASNWRIWWNILVPLSAPALITVGIFAFVAHWNDFLDPLIFLHTEQMKTLSLGLRAFINPNDASWHLTMAASMWLVAPMVIIFFLGQRYFVEGVAMSGITGR